MQLIADLRQFFYKRNVNFCPLQLKTYQEDFEAERRDRERMQDEKQSASLRYEAEITSLRLQLDRCRNELTHYTTEATRLGQQLRLKTQYEDDQYKKHLESRVSVSVRVCVCVCVCVGGGGGGGGWTLYHGGYKESWVRMLTDLGQSVRESRQDVNGVGSES